MPVFTASIGQNGKKVVGTEVHWTFVLILKMVRRFWCREGESNPQDPKVGGF
jgi:hypothetical protein